jgi:hypothetical protein
MRALNKSAEIRAMPLPVLEREIGGMLQLTRRSAPGTFNRSGAEAMLLHEPIDALGVDGGHTVGSPLAL